ncbi:hypothetical protein [Streptomyces cinerochromogenes]|uniref:hypothetical protein n=1 Tax=Streptomyces cinerochromogenes TaxID=66422 RepID=UPI0016715757|nr:hypothetical protein [Streptomyces cinerochromogenes]GGS49134.1 hypothetical protein GCM10010206_08310 [Streptomyces cinerochromogenes]
MTRLSRFQRLTLLAASATVITGGVLLPGTAFAAPASQTAAVTDVAAHWTQTTDSPSGISIQLPGKAEAQKTNDNGVTTRCYITQTPYGAMGFSVDEVPGTDASAPWDLQGSLKAAVDGYNSDSKSSDDVLRSTDVKEGITADGHRELSAELTAPDGTRGHIYLVDQGKYLVTVFTASVNGHLDQMDRDHQHALDSIKVPDSQAGQSDRADRSSEAPRSI